MTGILSTVASANTAFLYRYRRLRSVRRKGVAARIAGSAVRPCGHRALIAPPAGARPQLLFHLEVHARSPCLACGEIAKGQTMKLNRREFVQLAAAMGASLAWGRSARASTTGWQERRDLYPEGV